MDEDFHIGLILTLTAKAEFSPAVDFINDTRVSSIWITPRTAKVTDVFMITSHSLSFYSNITVNLQNTSRDSGQYTIWFLISSHLYNTERNNSHTRKVRVESKFKFM